MDLSFVLEKISDNAFVFLQLHKTVWPVARRESCFWSHYRQIKDGFQQEDVIDTHLVCNHSTEHPSALTVREGAIRLQMIVILVCNTCVIDKKKRCETRDKLTRKDIKTNITYCSTINPGGWVPIKLVRYIYEREYPRFLDRFGTYVVEKTKNEPIMW